MKISVIGGYGDRHTVEPVFRRIFTKTIKSRFQHISSWIGWNGQKKSHATVPLSHYNVVMFFGLPAILEVQDYYSSCKGSCYEKTLCAGRFSTAPSLSYNYCIIIQYTVHTNL
jgi:hypothetical protein